MNPTNVFELELLLPSPDLCAIEKTLLGFGERYDRVKNQLRLLLSANEIATWNRKFHGGRLQVAALVKEQYPLVIFHGDVGTGKTAMAECIANKLVGESKAEDAILFKLSNRIRGSGKVGEMSTLIAEAFQKLSTSAGKQRRAVLIVDEGDSLAAARSQEHSHHEDKVAVNTLIQGIDDLRRHGGRVVTFLCTNRLSALDPALHRRAAIVEEFLRPNQKQREALIEMDLSALNLSPGQIRELAELGAARDKRPEWTYSDVRTRWYPAALARAFPDRGLTLADLVHTAKCLIPSPVVEDR